MIETFPVPAPQTLALFDDVIDVRSPSEFAEDHLPGAINLAVLDDAERARVGTIYVQDSRFLARRIGAALIAANVARHLESVLADKGPKWRPLVYCWRGGMRSGAMATILSQIGWRVGVLDGGYRAWRRAVVAELCDSDAPLPLIAIDGATGVGKTAILKALADRGAQTIDLEGLARHRGSVFGADADGRQPMQKGFESALFDALRRFDLSRPIYVEAEANRIGRIVLPRRIAAALRAAPRVRIIASPAARAAFLVRAYSDVLTSPGFLARAIGRLKPFHARDRIAEWNALADAGAHDVLAMSLMERHYDPAYARAQRGGGPTIREISLAALADADIDAAAAAILDGDTP